MKILRNIYEDLLERRLWPVALVLLLALLAVPVVLAKSAGPAPAPTPPPALAGVPVAAGSMTSFVSQPAVQLTSVGRHAGRLDHLRAMNPFVQRHLAPVVKVLGPTSTNGPATAGTSPNAVTATRGSLNATGNGPSASRAASPSGAGSAGPGPSSGGGSVAPTLTPKFGPPAPNQPRSIVVSSLDVRFGPAGDPGQRRTLERLAPLPSRANPVLIYLGLLSDNKTAVFLTSSDAHADGDGRCVPNPQTCQVVRLQAGNTEFFDVTVADGSVKQYELDLLRINRHQTFSVRAARAAAQGPSSADTRLLRSRLRHAPVARTLNYDETTGTLTPQQPVGSLHPDPAWEVQISPDAAVAAIPGLAPAPAPAPGAAPVLPTP